MQADDLTREQARALKNKLQPMLSYLGRLKDRMRRKGFVADDRLLAAVCRAEDSVHALSVEVHYLVCGDRVGRAQPPDTPATRRQVSEQSKRLQH
jgi:hypothetical protein